MVQGYIAGDQGLVVKRPSFQFYPGDWLRDTALRTCSVGARGLWIDMICLMHEGSVYGYLKVGSKVILPSNLARMVGATLDEIEGWLSELEIAGVYSKDEDGCIYSRRMIRDEKIRESRAAGGSKGGNPALLHPEQKVGNKVENKVNLFPTPSSSSASASSSSKKSKPINGKSHPACPHTEIVALYHEILPELPQVKDWHAARQKLLKARWDEDPRRQDLEYWRKFFTAIRSRPFLMGENDRHWTADLEWMMSKKHFTAIREGKYRD